MCGSGVVVVVEVVDVVLVVEVVVGHSSSILTSQPLKHGEQHGTVIVIQVPSSGTSPTPFNLQYSIKA